MGRVKEREQELTEKEMDDILDDIIKGNSSKEQEEKFMAQVMKEHDRHLMSQRRQDFYLGGIVTAAIILLARILMGV